MRATFTMAALLLPLALAACGTRGNLTMPPGPAQPPILDRWRGTPPQAPQTKSPEASPAEKSGDLNTPEDSAR